MIGIGSRTGYLKFLVLIILFLALLLSNSFPAFSLHPNPNFAPCPAINSVSGKPPNANVTVTIKSVHKIDDFDPGFAFWDNEQDFYGYMFIDRERHDLAQIEGRDNAYFEKTFATVVTEQIVPIKINISDADENAPDHADINPEPNRKELDIFFNLCSRQVFGDVPQQSSTKPITSTGNGDEGHATKIIFLVGTSDDRPLSSDDLAITRVDLMQVIPYSEKIVQGKRAVLAVTVANNFINDIDTSVRFTINYEPLVDTGITRIVPIHLQGTEVTTLYFLVNENFVPPVFPPPKKYNILVHVEIDPDKIFRPADEKDCKAINDVVKDFGIETVTTRELKLLWSKVGSNKFATDLELANSRDFGDSFINATYPIPSLDVSTSPLPIVPQAGLVWSVIGETIAFFTRIPVQSLAPFLYVWELSLYAEVLSYDRIMGVLPNNWFSQFPFFSASGLSLIEMAPRAVIFYPDRMTLPAHELGHTFALSRETSLKNWLTFDSFPIIGAFFKAWDEYKLDPPLNHGRPANGFWVQHGGEPSQLLIAPNLINRPVCNAHGFMGNLDVDINTGPLCSGPSCPPSWNNKMTTWVDPENYHWLLKKLALPNDPTTIYISGVLTQDDRAFFSEWYKLQNRTVDIEAGSSGAYFFAFLNETGERLSEVGFNPTFGTSESFVPLPLTFFGFNLEFPNGTSKIQLWNNFSKTLLGEKIVSAHPPIVNITAPNVNHTVHQGENIDISWKGSDQDNDDLTYILALSQNADKWFPLAHLDETQFSLDTIELPRGEFLLKVIVTDGVNTAESQPIRFVVT